MKIYFRYGTHNDKKKLEQNINYRILHGKKQLDMRGSLNIPIKKHGWNFEKGIKAGVVNLSIGSRSPEDYEYFQSVKDKLDKIRQDFEKAFISLKVSQKHTSFEQEDWKNWAKENLEITLGIKEAKIDKAPFFLDKFEHYIKRKKLAWGKGTLRGYLSHKNVFEEFMKYKKHNYRTDEIDLDFYTELQEWSYEVKEQRPNTFGNHIKKVKAVIKYFIEEDKDDSFKFHKHIYSSHFQKISKSVIHEILTPDELDLVFNFESHRDSLNNVRDITKLLYWGCLRYGEFYEAIQQKPLKTQKTKKGFKWIVYVSKTDKIKTIPIHEDILTLIREDKLPRRIERESYVKYLKEILKECGIEKKRIGAHTIRRSFCTNMYNDEHSPAHIMVYSGHKTQKMLMEYIQEENRDLNSTIPTK
jgi:integrase